MFSRYEGDTVSFESKPKEEPEKNRSFAESSSQTKNESTDAGSQGKTWQSLEIQTDEIVRNTEAEYDSDKLASFLNRICPHVLEELDKIEKSKAFSVYRSGKEEHYETNVKVIHTIFSERLADHPQLKVSCLAWSCTGNVVIVAYGSPEHSDWCTHSSCVEFYNIKISEFNGKTPTYSVPISSCVTALAGHPYEPAVVAVGTAGGEVHVLNLQKGEFDADMGNSIFHEDKVTQLSWEYINSQLYLVSSSVDSYMFLYKITPSIGSIQLSERYRLTNDQTPLLAGILHFSFSKQPGVFVGALENGEIIHCSTFGAPIIIPSNSARYPVLRAMCKKSSLALDIKFSPTEESTFTVVYTDNILEIYSLKETIPIHQVFLDFDVMGLTWSKLQGNLILLWGKGTKLFVYNADTGLLITNLSQEGNSISLIKTLASSTKRSRIAVSGNDGKVVVCDLPEFFKISM